MYLPGTASRNKHLIGTLMDVILPVVMAEIKLE